MPEKRRVRVRKRKTPAPKTLKRSAGRPPHVITTTTRQVVANLVTGGFTQERIAETLGIEIKTLRKHYKGELQKSIGQNVAMLTQTALLLALGGAQPDHTKADSGMVRFLLPRLGAFKAPKSEIEHSGLIGNYDLTKLSDADLKKFHALASLAAVSGSDRGGNGEAEDGEDPDA